MDSTYQSAPFYVQRLVEETFGRIMAARKNDELPEAERNLEIKPPRCKNIILMTGTPESLSEVRLPVETSILDLRDQCRVVQPQNIHFVEKAQAEEQIKEQLQAGERVLYFSNHITPASELAERYGIARERVVMSFSDETRRQQLKETDAAEGNEDTGDYHRLLSVQEFLEKHSRIREDIALFVTTSKNKEGININDDDIRHVYIESHSMTDISQMAGRLRHGAENVYIILDSQGHPPGESRFDAFFAEHMCEYKLEVENQPPMQVHVLDDMLKKFRRREE